VVERERVVLLTSGTRERRKRLHDSGTELKVPLDLYIQLSGLSGLQYLLVSRLFASSRRTFERSSTKSVWVRVRYEGLRTGTTRGQGRRISSSWFLTASISILLATHHAFDRGDATRARLHVSHASGCYEQGSTRGGGTGGLRYPYQEWVGRASKTAADRFAADRLNFVLFPFRSHRRYLSHRSHHISSRDVVRLNVQIP
jgi:hypothetical protein